MGVVTSGEHSRGAKLPLLKVSRERLMGKQDCGTRRGRRPHEWQRQAQFHRGHGAEVLPMGSPPSYFHLVCPLPLQIGQAYLTMGFVEKTQATPRLGRRDPAFLPCSLGSLAQGGGEQPPCCEDPPTVRGQAHKGATEASSQQPAPTCHHARESSWKQSPSPGRAFR